MSLARTRHVRQVESSHPCECGELLLQLHCPGVAQLQLQLDARTQLPKGARLGVYLDAACTQEALALDADDFAAAESLCVPSERAWLLLTSEQNREHAWGFKVRATPMRWRARNEVALLAAPLDSGWETLQLLCEEASSQ